MRILGMWQTDGQTDGVQQVYFGNHAVYHQYAKQNRKVAVRFWVIHKKRFKSDKYRNYYEFLQMKYNGWYV